MHAAREIGQIQLAGKPPSCGRRAVRRTNRGDDEDQAEAEFTRRPRLLPAGRRLLGALEGRCLISKADLAAAAALIRYSIASAK